jgi:hypothetical protein
MVSSHFSLFLYFRLNSDLLSVNRTITPWIVVVMHCPWYSSNIAHYSEAQTVIMRDSMEKLFLQYKVNIVLTGHVHAYERTFPMFQNETRSDGVVYVTVGDGGNYGKTESKCSICYILCDDWFWSVLCGYYFNLLVQYTMLFDRSSCLRC